MANVCKAKSGFRRPELINAAVIAIFENGNTIPEASSSGASAREELEAVAGKVNEYIASTAGTRVGELQELTPTEVQLLRTFLAEIHRFAVSCAHRSSRSRDRNEAVNDYIKSETARIIEDAIDIICLTI